MTEKCYYLNTAPGGLRSGEHGEIVGVSMHQPLPDSSWRACFRVRYQDGFECMAAIDNHSAYVLTRKNGEVVE